MKLNYKQYSNEGEPLVILHGLFGNLKNWNWQARQLSSEFSVYSLDLRNHGDSPHDDTMSYGEMADDVLEFLDDNGIEQAHLLGHSMGGKVAMQLALAHPHRVARVLVADIAPVSYDRETAGHDAIFEGLEAVQPQSTSSRAEADSVLARFVADEPVRQFLLTNLERRHQGGFRWRFNLAALKANYGSLRDKPVGLKPSETEILFVKGALSNYIQEGFKDEILELFPTARVKTVMGAGHWLHAEKPQVFYKIARDFFVTGKS